MEPASINKPHPAAVYPGETDFLPVSAAGGVALHGRNPKTFMLNLVYAAIEKLLPS